MTYDAMICVATSSGRVLRDRHTDRCSEPWCAGCLPCTGPHCQVCGKYHAEHTCPLCLGLVRANLRELGRLASTLRGEAQQGRSAHHVGTGIPGGDALVLAAPAADPMGYRAQLAYRLANGLDVSHTLAELYGDPRPPLAALQHWEGTWRRELGQQPRSGSLGYVLSWLDDRLQELARSHSFPRFSRDVGKAVRQMEDVLHDGERPDRSRVPCLACGARLVKVYADSEDKDHHRCPRCGEHYDAGRFQRAKHDHLASQGAARYVSVADAVGAVGRPEQTVRAWMRKGLVAHVRDPKTGRVVVWWPDVREQHLQAAERKRSEQAR